MRSPKPFNRNHCFFAVYFAVIILASLAQGATRIYLSDFIAINGDFQNYNTFRRILAGQVPFVDFTQYLGIGVILINCPLLALHNTFTASLFVTNAVTCFICCISISFLSYLITKNMLFSFCMGAVAPLGAQSPYLCDFFCLVTPGYSMRMIRLFLPFLLAFIFYMARRKSDTSRMLARLREVCAIGLVLGFSLVWSNDYGVSCVISGGTIVFAMVFGNRDISFGRKILSLIILCVSVLIGALLSVSIVTRGNVGAYVNSITGIGSWQFWYYGKSPDKILTVLDAFRRIKWSNNYFSVSLIVCVAQLIYCGIKVLRRRASLENICALFVNFSVFIATFLYMYGSGGIMYEGMIMTQFVFMASSLYFAIKKAMKREFDLLFLFGLASACVFYFFVLYQSLSRLHGPRKGVFDESLGGYLTHAKGLRETSEYLDGSSFFSTYASAVEVIAGTFQPSGADYIIHALGDDNRSKYLHNFNTNRYPYVLTMRPDYTDWEYWIERANWDFYRLLYERYVPVLANNYHIVWKLSEEGVSAILPSSCYARQKRESETQYSIEVVMDQAHQTGTYIADIELSYEVDFTPDRWAHGAIKKVLMVQDVGIVGMEDYCYYLRDSSKQTYIPLVVVNGRGSVRLSSRPRNSTRLTLGNVRVHRLFIKERLELPGIEYTKVLREQ